MDDIDAREDAVGSIFERTAVVIPAYDPGSELLGLVDEVRRRGFAVVLVDDGTPTDRGFPWPEGVEGVTVIHHERNRGKGAAIKTGLGFVARSLPGARCVATMDADGQHLPADLAAVVRASWKHPGALVLGSRSFDQEGVPVCSAVGNRAMSWAFGGAARTEVADTQTGLRAFGRNLLPFLAGESGMRFEYEMNVLLDAAAAGVEIVEVPVATVYRDAGNSCSHFRRVRDSLRVAGSFVRFGASSLASAAIDFTLYGALVGLLPATGSGLVAAALAARLVSGSCNYALNRSVAFRSDRPHAAALPAYVALAATLLIADCAITLLLVKGGGLAPLPAKVISGVLLFLVSFSAQRLRVFPPRGSCAGKGAVA